MPPGQGPGPTVAGQSEGILWAACPQAVKRQSFLAGFRTLDTGAATKGAAWQLVHEASAYAQSCGALPLNECDIA